MNIGAQILKILANIFKFQQYYLKKSQQSDIFQVFEGDLTFENQFNIPH